MGTSVRRISVWGANVRSVSDIPVAVVVILSYMMKRFITYGFGVLFCALLGLCVLTVDAHAAEITTGNLLSNASGSMSYSNSYMSNENKARSSLSGAWQPNENASIVTLSNATEIGYPCLKISNSNTANHSNFGATYIYECWIICTPRGFAPINYQVTWRAGRLPDNARSRSSNVQGEHLSADRLFENAARQDRGFGIANVCSANICSFK